jgi:protein-disulfide isomerase
MSWRAVLDVTASVVMIAAAAAILATVVRSSSMATPPTREPINLPTEPVSLDAAPVLGDASAPVAMIVFSDFQCPFCLRFAEETLPGLVSRYVEPGYVQVAFRHLPLTSIHPQAQMAAEMSECARRQGQFWPAHDVLFGSAGRLQELTISELAANIGVDASAMAGCMGGDARGRVNADAAAAKSLGLSGTPTFIIGITQTGGAVRAEAVIRGAQPPEVFAAAFDELLGR